MTVILRSFALFLAITAMSASSSFAQPAHPELLRVSAEGSGPSYLQVPVVHYVLKKGPNSGATLDFYGAVHLGDTDYFESLNKRFKGYDAVLFELIADPERVKDIGNVKSDSILGTVQRKLSEFLGLSFQLDKVRYDVTNFVHADLTPEEFTKAMQTRGESLPQLLMRVMQLSLNPEMQKRFEAEGLGPASLAEINPLFIVLRGYTTDKERSALRRYMAKGLSLSDELLSALEGEQGSTIISDRNKRAIEVLKAQLGNGKRKIALYYGVGHLPDFHKRLTSELGFADRGTTWIKAWKLD